VAAIAGLADAAPAIPSPPMVAAVTSPAQSLITV
jgi:hypothetical protein